MAYYAESINYTTQDSARFTIVTATSTSPCVQLYVDGQLIDSAIPAGSYVEFRPDALRYGEWIRLLGVDVADAETDYFSDAFPYDAANRETIRTPTVPGIFRDEQWRVYLDDVLIKERPVWPYPDSLSCRIGGRGTLRGWYRGIEDYGSGRANWRGLQRGYEPVTLEHVTDVLVCGDYEFKTAVVDKVGNEALTAATTVSFHTYPRVNSELTVTSYVLGTDTLTFSFTESEDV